MSCEAELPGRKLNKEELQMIYCRYYTISQFVKDKQVLDVGCGAGIGLGYLVRKGAKHVVGGDYSKDNLRIAKQHYTDNDKITLIYMDAHNIPFWDNYFDVLSAMQVLQYLDANKFVTECYRVLKPGGALILSIPNKDRKNGFTPSALGKNYYSAPELFALLAHNFDTKLFGVFPAPEKPKTIVKQNPNIRKIINLIPKSVREYIGNIIDHRNFVLANELEDGIVETTKLTPISHKHLSSQHKILYAIAYAQDKRGR